MVSRLLTAEEVAALLGVELDTLYRYARGGRIRGAKIGKHWRFAESDVEAFIRAQYPTGSPEPAPLTLPAALAATVRRGSSGAIVCGGIRTGWAEIDRKSDLLAASFLARGVRPGDRVLSVLPNTIEFIVACFAAWKVGAIAVPEYSGIRPANLRHVLADAAPAALIVDHTLAEQIDWSLDGPGALRVVYVRQRTFTLSGLNELVVESLDAVLESREASPFQPPSETPAQDVATLSYTSGSTGLPKGVMHTHASILASAEFTRSFGAVGEGDTIVIPLPLHHGLAFRQIFAYMLAGATVVVTADIYQALKLLRELRPSALVLVPAAVNIILDHFAQVLAAADAHLRYVEIGSAAIAPQRLERLRLLLPSARIHLPYGLTEARVGFLEAGSEGLYNRLAVVAPGLTVSVIDPEGNPVAPGQTGEILLHGKGLMKGYWNRPIAELEAIANVGFRTGDMARLTPDGKAELLGRLDLVYKVGGRKVHPGEIEMAVCRHPAVAEAAVVAMQDPKGVFEVELHAFVVVKRGCALSEDELGAHCRQHIEPYKLPARIHFRNSLPKSAVGKVLRQELTLESAAG